MDVHFVRQIHHLRERIWELLDAIRRVQEQTDTLVSDVASLQADMTALRAEQDRASQAADFSARSIFLTHRRPRVLFLIHNFSTWYAYDELFRLLSADPGFDVLAATIPKRFPGSADFSGEDSLHASLEALGIPHIRLPYRDSEIGLDLIRSWEPDLLFRQSQWDADIPPAYAVARLNFTRLCFIPYHMLPYAKIPAAESERGDGVWDSDLQRASWVTFCTCQEVKDAALRRQVPFADQRMVVTGHPKVHHILTATPSWPIPAPSSPAPKPFRVLWDAHHTVLDGWFQFGMFPRIAHDMLSWARDEPDVQFVFAPHPGLVSMIANGQSGLTPEQLEAFTHGWEALPNTATAIEEDYAPLFAASDVLISDGISLLAEYQITGKPVIFVERPDHAEWNEIGSETVKGTHPVRDVAAARAYVAQLRQTGVNPLQAAEAANRQKFFPESDAAPRILDSLRSRLAAEFTQFPEPTAGRRRPAR